MKSSGGEGADVVWTESKGEQETDGGGQRQEETGTDTSLLDRQTDNRVVLHDDLAIGVVNEPWNHPLSSQDALPLDTLPRARFNHPADLVAMRSFRCALGDDGSEDVASAEAAQVLG